MYSSFDYKALAAFADSIVCQSAPKTPKKASKVASDLAANASSSSTAPTNSQTSSPLFKLPPELRNTIYVYVFTQSEDNDDSPPSDNLGVSKPVDLYNVEKIAPSGAFLLSCRLTLTEGQSLFLQAQRDFWKENIFSIELREDWSDATAMPEPKTLRLREEQVNSIQTLFVVVRASGTTRKFAFTSFPCAWVLDADLSECDPADLSAVRRGVAEDMRQTSISLNKLGRRLGRASTYLDSVLTNINFATMNGIGVNQAKSMIKPVVR